MTTFTKIFRRSTYETISPAAAANIQKGKTVLIAGGSEGIGFHTAQAFAEAEADRIIILARNAERLENSVASLCAVQPNTRVEGRPCDLVNVEAINSLWNSLSTAGIFIDTLVLAAARTGLHDSLKEAQAFLDLNIMSNMCMLEAFQNQPDPNSRPKILLNLTSAAWMVYPYPRPMYAASKAAFASYLCHLADEVDNSKLRIVNLHPGAVYTPAAHRAQELPEDLPLWDNPNLSAHVALWSCGRDAAFLHGRVIWANWDVDELLQMKDEILSDPGLLKMGVTGVASASVPSLLQKCEETKLAR